MDNLRGTFGSNEPDDVASLDDARGYDAGAPAAPAPAAHSTAIGQDERRMQVRAYNHWASQLEDRVFPLIEELDPANLADFGPYSVLIDFTGGIDDPAVQFLGDKLAAECGSGAAITRLSDVPPRSLLSRITDHYLQILANHAPIGFEAEFINQRGASTLYRGILLPYSSDGETIDFLYGVINWKELADQVTADELLLEIDQALDLAEDISDAYEAGFDDAQDAEPDALPRRAPDALTTWADSPAAELAGDFGNIAPLGLGEDEADDFDDLPVPQFGLGVSPDHDFAHYTLDAEDYDEDFDEDEGVEDESIGYNFASLADYIETPVKKAIDPAQFVLADEDDDFADADYGSADFGADINADPYTLTGTAFDAGDVPLVAAGHIDEPADMIADDVADEASLHDYLAAAREWAHAAGTTEDRSRSALYAAVSRAYDFSLAALDAPEDYAELLAEAGLSVQERAPMTPVVKLVFGADYDKTRLTEYAAVLSHAHRLTLERGTLAQFLEAYDGGLKAVVKAERRMRRGDVAQPAEPAPNPAALREALAQALRDLAALTLEDLDGGGPEFALVLVRRDEVGCVEILGELPEDIAAIEQAANKLVG